MDAVLDLQAMEPELPGGDPGEGGDGQGSTLSLLICTP